MRRFAITVCGVPLRLLLAVGPVVADTTGGGNGTSFNSFAETCSTSSGRQTCTDTQLSVNPNGDGTSSACLDIFTYANSTNGRFTFLSDQFGCAADPALTVGSDWISRGLGARPTPRTSDASTRPDGGAAD